MPDIWYLFGFYIAIFIVFIATGIVYYIKKFKHYIFVEIFIIASLIFLTIYSFPYIKDIVEQETTEITAVYVDVQKGNGYPGARKLVLKNEDETYIIISSNFTKVPAKMEQGKTYKIEYYNNTKVIKNYILIE